MAGASALGAPGTNRSVSERARRLRTVAWAALPLMALAYYLLLMAPLPPFTKLIALEVVYCAPIVLTIAWSWRARALSEGRESTFWASMAGANLTLLACEVLLVAWVGAISPAGPPRVSWPFHGLHAIAAVLFVIGLIALSRWRDATMATQVRWGLDVASTMLVAAALVVQLYVLPIMAPAGATTAEVLLGAAYPLFGLLMIMGTVSIVVGFKVDRWRPWDKLFAVSLSIYAVAIALWPMWYPTAVQTSRNYERGVLDLVQFTGHWLLMAAAVYRLTEVGEWRLRTLPPTFQRHRWATAVSPLVALAAVPAIAVFAAQSYGTEPWFAFYIMVLALLTALTIGRSTLIALENGSLFHLSVTDPLTGLYNHRFFFDRLRDEIHRADRYGEQLTLVAIDIDDFTAANTRLGLVEGERLLRQVASLLTERCSGECIVARIGGDDFGVIMPNTAPLDGAVLARGLLDAICISAGHEPRTVTASAGLATYPQHAEDAEGLVRIAQGALYQAKQAGGERLVSYEDERVPDMTATERVARLESESRNSSVQALAAAVEARDSATYRHARAVSALVRAVAERLGLDDSGMERATTAALLHDVGRIGTRDNHTVTELLTGRDWDAMRDHSAMSQRILGASGLNDLMPVLRSRHEWWDGTGRPDGLAGDEIPVEARILAACHFYEAAITDHGHRHAMSRREAQVELRVRAGSQFDLRVVDALTAVLDQGPSAAGG